jgi:NAD(P)-dependent dehydrogenase (short-subunit alcohol dehydrogenase family)
MAKGAIFITGAAKGIGEACALHFARLGWLTFAGVRREEDGQRLRQEAGEKLIPLQVDVTKPEQVQAAGDRIAAEVGEAGLLGLVNNAGVAVAGPMEFTELEDIRWQFEVNYFGQIAVTQAVMPLLRKAKGRVVNMSSVSGRFVYPFFGPYAGSKHALEAFTDALRRELLPWGIEVISVEPGAIATPIWDTSLQSANQRTVKLTQQAHEYYGEVFDRIRQGAMRSGTRGLPAQAVADVVYKAITASRPKTRYVVGRRAKWTVYLFRHLPDRLIDAVVKRVLYK